MKMFKLLNLVLLDWIVMMTLVKLCSAIAADNSCTFHIGGKLFSLLYLDKQKHYKFQLNDKQTMYINFCTPFVPTQCPSVRAAYSFLITKFIQQTNQTNQLNQTIAQQSFKCERYSSDSYLYFFSAMYDKQGNTGTLQYSLNTEATAKPPEKRETRFSLKCTNQQALSIDSFMLNQTVMAFQGGTKYGCPVFEVSSIWKVFRDNWLLIGLVLIIMGFQLLFFGRATIEITIFLASFFIIFAILGSIFTIFLTPYSSTFLVYFSFILLLFFSTMLSYGVSQLVDISIFFVGAIFGFIVGMLINSLFCSIFDIYSVWSLVIFQIIFTIPFGLLSFKYTDEIIIASSSLTGAYFIIRPISWIFGGFPNQFLLYHMVQTNQVDGLPWSFYLYLIFIIALALVGAMYQLIKLYRQNPNEQIEINFIQQTIEQPIDRIKMNVDKLIERFKSDKEPEDYRKMKEMKHDGQSNPKIKSDSVREDLF